MLWVACVAGASAGAAFAGPPGGPQPDPELLPPASVCQQLPHPTATCTAVAVTCPSSPKAQFACKTVASSEPAGASVLKLELQLPRRYSMVRLQCQVRTEKPLSCRVTSRTTQAATGHRVVVLDLTGRNGLVRIGCATAKTFACRLTN
jgi:hypothetical protein